MPVGVPEVPVWAAFVLNETLFPIQGHGPIRALPLGANDLGRLAGS